MVYIFAMEEIWKNVLGWEEAYEVSSLGRVRSKSRSGVTKLGVRVYGNCILKPFSRRKGYPEVNLMYKGKRKREFVHRLILLAFYGEPPEGFVACHNDGNPSNCTLDNLRWDTVSGNFNDRYAHGTAHVGEKNPAAKLTNEQVKIIRQSKEPTKVLSQRYKVGLSAIISIRNNTTWKGV